MLFGPLPLCERALTQIQFVSIEPRSEVGTPDLHTQATKKIVNPILHLHSAKVFCKRKLQSQKMLVKSIYWEKYYTAKCHMHNSIS